MKTIKTVAQTNSEAINSIGAYLVDCQFFLADNSPAAIKDKACNAITHIGSIAATLANFGYLSPKDMGDLDKVSIAVYRAIGRCRAIDEGSAV